MADPSAAGRRTTRAAVVDGKTGAVAAIGLLLLWRYKVKEPFIVLLGAMAGLLLH